MDQKLVYGITLQQYPFVPCKEVHAEMAKSGVSAVKMKTNSKSMMMVEKTLNALMVMMSIVIRN